MPGAVNDIVRIHCLRGKELFVYLYAKWFES